MNGSSMDRRNIYQETDAPKRLELLKQNTENELTQADVFRKKLWVARYGKRKPTKDAFVGSLMELKCLAEGTSLDFGGQRRKQAAKIISRLCLAYADSLDEELRRKSSTGIKKCLFEIYGSQQRRKRIYFTCVWNGTSYWMKEL